ncbi:MAG: hypothetical protein AAB855_00350 [Patescibacteria group bacterium]
MDQQYVCPQCGEESDIQGPCPMCGLPMVPAQSDQYEDDTSFDEVEGDAKPNDEESLEDEEEDAASYNPYEE